MQMARRTRQLVGDQQSLLTWLAPSTRYVQVEGSLVWGKSGLRLWLVSVCRYPTGSEGCARMIQEMCSIERSTLKVLCQKSYKITKILSPQISIFEYHDFIILKVLWASIEKHQLSCYLEIILDAAWLDVADFPPEIAKCVFKFSKIFKLRAPPGQMSLLAGGFNLSPKMGFKGFLKS